MIRVRALALTMNVLLRSASVLALALAALAAQAETIIDFESASTSSSAPIPNGYAGFNWSNFAVITKADATSAFPDYASGITSGSYAGFNNFGNPASILVVPGSTLITGFAGNFTSISRNTLTVQGFVGGVLTQTTTVDLSGTSAYGFTFAAGVDQVRFSKPGTAFLVDDLRINPTPEPTTFTALGLGAVAMLRRRKRA